MACHNPRRWRARAFVGSLLVAASFYVAAVRDASAQTRPNIVFILIDDAGFSDFGSYGGEIGTPNLDQIANEGMRFSNYHAASTCEATRVMLQSGIDNHRAGAGTLQVVIADNQKGKPGYEGYLSDQAHSLGELMRDGGYSTYYAGKWNIGNGVERSPGARGWDRYIALEQTGADNYEAKVYAPFNMEAVWWEDGHRAVLPPDFFSTRYYFDKMTQYIEEGKASGKPFLAMIATQAVHSPLQAPNSDIDKYIHRYDAGWEKIRSERYQRQLQMGLVPAGLELPKAPGSKKWEDLSEQQRREYAKKMAVYAGMLDNVDQHVGRFREYLKRAGIEDNTVFIIMSDNGADAYDLSQLNLPFKLWYHLNFALGFETLGQKGSYVHYGQDWAQVSNTPFTSFKGTSFEGGMRVPFAISYPGRIKPGGISNQFAYVTDFLPTVLDIAGISLPGDEYKGRKLHRPTGTSLLPYLEGKSESIHPPTEALGFESTGGRAVFKGDYKLVFNTAPWGDGVDWRLVKLSEDPTESHDLSASLPELRKDMEAEFVTFAAREAVIEPPADYNPLRQLLSNNWPVLVRQMAVIIAVAAAAVVFLLAIVVFAFRRWWHRPMKLVRPVSFTE